MGDIIVWIIVGIVALLAVAGVFFFVRSRRAGEEVVYHFRCPGCKRKLRYYARQVGHRGMCTNCREPFTFPAISREAR
jgi:hypothetical protein